MIQLFTPNTEQLARGVALNAVFRFGMQTGEALKVSDVIGSEGTPELLDLGELEGRTWLTSLVLRYSDKSFTFQECLISLNMEKNIVSTALQGRNATIKE